MPKILFASNCSIANTGFAKNARVLLQHLAKTGKYEIVEFAIGGHYLYRDPRLARLPWKTYGAIPEDPNFHAHIQNLSASERESYLKMVAYGGMVIDDLIKEEKPTHFIINEDPWAIPDICDKPWWNKIHSLFWTPIDSEPILDLVIQQARVAENYAVCMGFAKRAIEKILPDKNIHVIHNSIPGDVYDQPFIDEEKRQDIRAKLQLMDEDLLIFMNARNQGRKLFYSNFQALQIFKERNPEAKAKILLNTSFSEGWQLVKQAKEFGIEQDLFCTYVCEHCGAWDIRNFIGDGADCPACKSQKTFRTPTSKTGVDEETLRLLYMISDCYSHPATNGGFEIPLLEAALCKCPIGTIDYSFGEDFCENPEVFAFTGLKYKELQSNFWRFCPDPSSVASFFEKIHGLTRDERLTLGGNIQNWAKEKFSSAKACKFVEDWIDNSPAKDFDYDFEKFRPNPNHPFPVVDTNEEFVDDLYVNILKMRPDPKGRVDWLENLRNGRSRESVYKYFINKAQSMLPAENSGAEQFINDWSKDRLAYIVKGNGRDAYSLASKLESGTIYNQDVYVVVRQEYFSVFEGLDLFLIPFHEAFLNESFLKGAGKEKPLFQEFHFV